MSFERVTGYYGMLKERIHMDLTKSLDEVNLIAALLCDVHKRHGDVFNTRALRLTLSKVRSRVRAEGLGFLTKTLPRLGKAFDKALAEISPLNAVNLGFKPYPNCEFPMLLGELFNDVLNPDGSVLQYPCPTKVGTIREILYCFYKYELPYDTKQEQAVLLKFEKTEEDITSLVSSVSFNKSCAPALATTRRIRNQTDPASVVREARIALNKLFEFFDCRDITPRHGPGAVATKQKLQDKFRWSNISSKITEVYPLDEYFYASLGHFCDSVDYEDYKTKSYTNSTTHDDAHISNNGKPLSGNASLYHVWKNQIKTCVLTSSITDMSLPARVILVPKDSRGPRLISCEPVDYQWIQQGLARAIVCLVESHPLTKWNVHFTDQQPNQFGALLGSESGKYATLDLNEASDRVSVALVRSLFPSHVFTYLEACRSLATELPDGRVITLQKYAPMGSALCFPILALTVWSLLYAAAPNDDTRESILVYGDDVIVPTAYAENAMNILESFGLKINQDKSCTKGFFRESCGVDAFKGVNVTPVRIRTVWSHSPSPDSYSSWVSYANSFYDKKWFTAYDYIAENLRRLYGWIPERGLGLPCPSLAEPSDQRMEYRTRINKRLQKREFNVWDVVSKPVIRETDGWSMLLRYFTEGSTKSTPVDPWFAEPKSVSKQAVDGLFTEPFSVRLYTERRRSMLRRRWR